MYFAQHIRPPLYLALKCIFCHWIAERLSLTMWKCWWKYIWNTLQTDCDLVCPITCEGGQGHIVTTFKANVNATASLIRIQQFMLQKSYNSTTLQEDSRVVRLPAENHTQHRCNDRQFMVWKQRPSSIRQACSLGGCCCLLRRQTKEREMRRYSLLPAEEGRDHAAVSSET